MSHARHTIPPIIPAAGATPSVGEGRIKVGGTDSLTRFVRRSSTVAPTPLAAQLSGWNCGRIPLSPSGRVGCTDTLIGSHGRVV